MKEDFHDVLEITEADSETHGDGPMKGRIIPETNDDKKGKVLTVKNAITKPQT